MTSRAAVFGSSRTRIRIPAVIHERTLILVPSAVRAVHLHSRVVLRAWCHAIGAMTNESTDTVDSDSEAIGRVRVESNRIESDRQMQNPTRKATRRPRDRTATDEDGDTADDRGDRGTRSSRSVPTIHSCTVVCGWPAAAPTVTLESRGVACETRVACSPLVNAPCRQPAYLRGCVTKAIRMELNGESGWSAHP
jgi:hypothetical protein